MGTLKICLFVPFSPLILLTTCYKKIFHGQKYGYVLSYMKYIGLDNIRRFTWDVSHCYINTSEIPGELSKNDVFTHEHNMLFHTGCVFTRTSLTS